MTKRSKVKDKSSQSVASLRTQSKKHPLKHPLLSAK